MVVAQKQLTLVDHFLMYHRSDAGHSQATCDTYELELDLLARYISKPIEDASKFDLQSYIASNADLAPSTRAKKIHAMRSYYNWLVDVMEYRADNPARKLRVPKLEESPPKYMEHEEVIALKDNCIDPNLSVLIDVMYATGIRIGEAVNMKRNDVLWQAKKVRVKGKGNKVREIPISSTALASLERYLNRRMDTEPTLFVNKKRKPLCARTIQQQLNKLGAEIGMERMNISPHKLRHSFATTLRNQGVSIDIIGSWMGHANLKTTMRYARVVDKKQMETYQHALPEGM